MRGAEDLRDWLLSRRDEWLSLLHELVEIESHSSDPRGVERVGQTIVDLLVPEGFSFQSVAQSPPAPERRWLAEVLAAGVDQSRMAPTLVGRRDGEGPDRLLLLGDLDTAYEPGSLQHFPFTVRDGRALGPGVADAKGGLVVLVAALSALRALDLPAPPIAVLLSGDEQAGSLGSGPVIAREALASRWCFCMECAREGGKVMVSRAHIGVGRLVVTGRESHAGSSHSHGINAIHALAEVLPKLTALTNPSSGVFVTGTIIRGGSRRSVVPGSAEVILDVRTPDQKAWDTLAAMMLELVLDEDAGSEARYDLALAAHRPGLERTDEVVQLFEFVKSVGHEFGIDIEETGSSAAGSSAFAAEAGCIVLDGMGPAGGDLMTKDEYIEVDSIVERSGVLAMAMSRLAVDPPRR